MKKKLCILVTLLAFSTQTVFASVLGNLIDSTSMLIAPQTEYYNSTFLSTQKGVGNQTEYFTEYTPNPDTVPVVVTGESIWGTRTILQAMEYMQKNQMQPMIGINASYFSFSTGIPMGHVISNGEITSKDGTVLPSIGFREDGTAFVADLGIYTTATFGEYIVEVTHINKYCQNSTQVLTLYTDAFDTTTRAQPNTINILLSVPDEKLQIGNTVTATVEDIIYENGSVAIPAGKMVLTLNMDGNQWIKQLLQTLQIGDTVEIQSEATTNPELWNTAYNALGSEGKQLIKNGEIQSGFEAGAAPRTAVGITESGSVIFYVLDGRQQGYSYGAKQETIAKRMLELGCTDAINLDGGGSTSIAGVYPGSDTASVFNSPSEGSLRQVTNFIFLQNMQEATGVLDKLYIYPQSQNMLAGSSVQIETKAVDTSFYAMPEPQEITYSIKSGSGIVSQNGTVTAGADGGTLIVQAEGGGVTGTVSYTIVDTPDITVYNAQNSKEITSIAETRGTEINLYAAASQNGLELTAQSEQFHWELSSAEIGEITQDGKLTLSDNIGAAGVIRITAGKTTKEIPVEVTGDTNAPDLYPYSEIREEDGTLFVDMYSYNAEFNQEACAILLDGNDITTADTMEVSAIDAQHIQYRYPLDTGSHKVTVLSALQSGYKALHTWYTLAESDRENPFDDTQKHWAKGYIQYMHRAGVVNGIIEGNRLYFEPDTPITRSAFAVMMANFLGIDPEEYADVDLTVFADSDSIPAWSENAVKAMYSMGIISGSLDNGKLYFNPLKQITRAEIMAILARTLPDELRVADLEYADRKSIPGWAKDAAGILTNAGLVSGYTDNTIRPQNPVTRAEAAVMLFNVL